MAKQKKVNHICLYADFGCTTGFGKVSKELIDNWNSRLGKDVELIVFAINDHSEKPYDYKNAMIVPAHTQALPDTQDPYCRIAFLNFIANNDFNIVMFINDLEVLRTMKNHISDIKKEKKKLNRLDFKTVFYFPIDSLPRYSDLEILTFFDEVVTYTEYAKNVILASLPKLKTKVKVVPHGTDTKNFYKLEASEELATYKKDKFGQNVFVFGTVNRNSCRKDVATTILAFHSYLDTWKKAFESNSETKYSRPVLYLHMNIFDSMGVSVTNLCERIGLEIGKDVFYPAMFSENKGVEDSELNKIYNCMDVFISNTTAEGWGLTITEAMACEIPVICPIHTSLDEITSNGEFVLPIRKLEPVVFIGDGEKVRMKSDLEQTINSMAYAYTSIVYGVGFKDMTQAAKKHVSKWNWNHSANTFWSIFEKHFKK
jgi:glycosyltransferase involved in cell wall biosynthesis